MTSQEINRMKAEPYSERDTVREREILFLISVKESYQHTTSHKHHVKPHCCQG